MMFDVPLRIVFGMIVGVIVQVGPTHAGQDPLVKAEDEEKIVTRVIQLNNLGLEEAVSLVNDLLGDELRGVARAYGTSSLIVRGYASTVDEANNVITDVDSRQTSSSETRTAYIPVQTYPLDKLMPLVSSLCSTGWTQIGSDHVNTQLVVSGAPKDIEAIRSLVEKIDRPARSLRIEFAFIRGDVGAGRNAGVTDLPKAMMPIAQTLLDNGFGSLTLMAPLIVRADAGSEFDSNSNLSRENESLQFRVWGIAQLQPGEDTAQLKLGAGMEGTHHGKREKGEPPKPKARFTIETTVTARLGDYTILAASPSSTEEGSAVALVVRVTCD